MATPSPRPRRFRGLFGGSSPEDEGSRSDGDDASSPTPLSVVAKHTRSVSERRKTPVKAVVKESLRPVLSDPYSLYSRWYVYLVLSNSNDAASFSFIALISTCANQVFEGNQPTQQRCIHCSFCIPYVYGVTFT